MSDQPTTSLLLPRPDPLGWTAWNMCAQLSWATLASGHFSQSTETPTPATRAHRSSIDFGLVKMSVRFVASRILMLRNRLCQTASCTHNSFVSMCRCFPSPSPHPIDFAADESIMMSMGIFHPSSSNTAFKFNASTAPRTSALLSASPLEVATMA